MSVLTINQLIPSERIHKSSEVASRLGNYGEYIVQIQTEEEIASILQLASRNQLTVFLEGAGTKRGYGGIREKGDILISLKEYRGVIEHSEGDMTMTVRAGTTIEEIQAYLQPYGQMLPLDPAWASHATIGGVIAANESGPKRLRYGSARDHVIGARVVYPDGRVLRMGGKVVKNVAGYDMTKLLIGSMGTLGVLTDITVKLRPRPRYQSLVLISFIERRLDSVRSFAVKLLDSSLEPVSLEILNESLAEKLTGKKLPTLAIAFEDVEKAVRYQEDWIAQNQPEKSEITILAQKEAEDWWTRFSKASPIGTAEDDMDLAIKMGTKNLDVLAILECAQSLAEQTGLTIHAHGGLGHGLSKVYIKGNEDQAASYIHELRAFAEQKGGYAFLQHASLQLRQQLDPWGKKPAYFSLLEGIKKSVDPGSVMNPQRFIGGI